MPNASRNGGVYQHVTAGWQVNNGVLLRLQGGAYAPMNKTETGRIRQKGGGKGYARAERGRRGSGAGAAGERSEFAAHAPRRRRPRGARAEPAQGAGQGRAEHGSRTSGARSATVRREDDGGKP